MAYVTKCKYDVFISYCQKNNTIPVGAKTKAGWVDNFRKQLKMDLELQKGITTTEIFIDYKELLPGEDLDDALKNAIQNSAILLVILSKKYLESGWCKKERDEFTLKNKEFSDLIDQNSQSELGKSHSLTRVFVVEHESIERNKWPRELKSTLPTQLWGKDDRDEEYTLGLPEPRTEQTLYYTTIRKLSKGIANQLRELKKRADQKKWAPGDSGLAAMRKTIKDEHRPPDIVGYVESDEDYISLVIDSRGKTSELETLICETAMENHVGYVPLKDDHENAKENRKNFMNKIKVYGGFMIVHEYDSEEKITAKINAYKKAIGSRNKSNPLCKKGRAFIVTPVPGNPPSYSRPVPKTMFSHVHLIKHTSLENTKDQLNKFFQAYKKEIGLEEL